MKKKIWHIRIPTFAALLLVVGSIAITSYVVQTGVFVVTKATPQPEPKYVRVVNVTEKSFTVVFTTTSKTNAAIQLTQNGENKVYFDTRNKEKNGAQATYYSHLISVDNLDPDTDYSFSIISDGKVFLDGENPYQARTAPKLAQPSTQKEQTITGTLILPDGAEGTDTVVIATVGSSQPIATLTDEKGNYTFSLQEIRNESLQEYFSIDPDEKVHLQFLQQDSESNVSIFVQDASAVPLITLTNDYDFTAFIAEQDDTTATPSASFDVPEEKKTRLSPIQISSPTNGSSLTDERPRIQGTAVPYKEVDLSISNSTIETTLTANGSGFWSYRPQIPLSIGEHDITIKTQDNIGIARQVTHTVTIFSSGSQIADSATPSAQPTEVPTPTPTTVIATPTPLPTAVPTIEITPTEAPAPTLEPTPIITTAPTTAPIITTAPTRQPIDEPGGETQTLVLTFASLVFIVTGATILFLL